MNARSGFLTVAVPAIALAWMLVLCPAGAVLPEAGAASTYVTITAPRKGATVRGTITIATSESTDVSWINVFVNGNWVASNPSTALPPYWVTWNSTAVADGIHIVSVTGYDANNAPIAIAATAITVQNHPPAPTPTPRYNRSRTATPTPHHAATPTARPTPTPPKPTPVPSCIRILTPAGGAAVHGSNVAVDTNDICSGRWFESLYIDDSHVSDFAPGAVVLNSTKLRNGTHTIKVTSQSANPGSRILASAYETLNVDNGSATPTPTTSPRVTQSGTPKPSPTARATAVAHLGNLAPNSALPAESTCAALANQSNFPETSPENANDGTGWNGNNQIWTTPSYFYTNAGRNGLAPAADFAPVNGQYAGTTQDIIRWAACKWGVDEDWAYAETAEETGSWTNACAQMHGGTTCHETGDCGNFDSDSGGETPNLSFIGFPVTDSSGQFIGPNKYNGQNADGATCSATWSSWSIIQSKARYFEWYAWPMLAVSTAWGEDYRWAKYRACVNGDYATWFGDNPDYLNAVSRARSNPNGIVPAGQAGPTNLITNETNMQYLGMGCIATHYSGNWYDGGAISYLTNSGSGFLDHLNGSNWPGARR